MSKSTRGPEAADGRIGYPNDLFSLEGPSINQMEQRCVLQGTMVNK